METSAIWKDIEGYEGIYQVAAGTEDHPSGKVRALKRELFALTDGGGNCKKVYKERVLKNRKNIAKGRTKAYYFATLYPPTKKITLYFADGTPAPASMVREKAGKHRNLHRLIAEAFIPNPENKPMVDHKDGNSLNNKIENLRWVTASENLMNRAKFASANGRAVTSKYKGVSLAKVKGKVVSKNPWIARGKSRESDGQKHLGVFATEEEAARAHDEFIKKEWGSEFAQLNFSDEN